MPTTHMIVLGDARSALAGIATESVHLVCTSPPYGSLKQYPPCTGQLGNIAGYDRFLRELDLVWAECLRILVPGGRITCVVADACISRRGGGRLYVLPLSADIQVRARQIGFDNLTPIRWLRAGKASLGESGSSRQTSQQTSRQTSRQATRHLGKPNLPNGTVDNDLEHILMLRKPGGYRSPTEWQEEQSRIDTEDYMRWFSPIWSDVTDEGGRDHPAPFPEAISLRLVRMFSFAGDWVVDPFAGTGTTAVAANATGRNSVMVEIEPAYVTLMEKRLRNQPSAGLVSSLRHEPGTALDLGAAEAAS